MPTLVKINSTVKEPIRFFLMYTSIDRNSLFLQYKKLDGYDGYFDSVNDTAYVKTETRIDKDEVETSFEELSFEDFIKNRFSDEVSKSKSLITKFYKKTTVKNDLELSYEKLLRAFVENFQQFKNIPTYPESQLLPSALIEIVNHAMHLCRDLFPSNALVIKAKLLLEKEFSGNTEDNHKIESEKQINEQSPNYSDLFNDLSTYITGINTIDFTNIIVHHSLSPGTRKAQWIGKRVDAHRFATFLKMPLLNFNKCISMENGKKLRENDKDKLGKQSIIGNILEKYISH